MTVEMKIKTKQKLLDAINYFKEHFIINTLKNPESNI